MAAAASPPAAAPASPAAPAVAPAPATPATHVQPPGEQPESAWLSEVGADIEEFDRTGNQPQNRPRQGAAPKPAAPPPDDDLEVPAPPEKPAAAARPGEQPVPPAAEDETRLPAPQLRKAHAELKKKVNTEYEPELQRLRAQVKQLEERPAAEPEETKTRLTELQKRVEEQEAHIRFVDYQNSEDYLKNYWQPYQDAWNEALSDLNELEVENRFGTRRPATQADINHLASLKLGERRNAANAMFGDSADDVMAHVRKILDLSQKQSKALADNKANSAKLAQERQNQALDQNKQRIATWERQNSSLATKYPDWFAKNAQDPTGSTLLDKGFLLADLLFGEVKEPQWGLLPKSFQDDLRANGGKLSPEGRIRLHAVLRNKAAAFDRIAYQLKEVKAELAEAKKALSEYEDSEPPVGGSAPRRAGAPAVGSVDEANAELEALDRVGR